MDIPFYSPDITDEDIAEVVDTLKSGWITTGPKTALFEKKLSEYTETEYTVCLNSATAGLEFILRFLGIGEGDEVIVPAYTYTATASVVFHVGARAVMADCASDSYEMDYGRLSDLITEKTKAVICVDLAGIISCTEKVFEAAELKKGLFKPNNGIQSALGRIAVIADAAHSLGAVRNSMISGSIADFTSFSFHAVKNLTTAEGGAVTWRRGLNIEGKHIYQSMHIMSLHGQTKSSMDKISGNWEYDVVSPYYKNNMTDMSAALGLSQLRRYTEILRKRHYLIEIYDNEFRDCGISLLRHVSDNFKSSGHLYFIGLRDKGEIYRNSFINKMAENGIKCNVHYKPLPLLSAYKNLGYDIKDYPNAYKMYANQVTLPLFTSMTDDMTLYIAENVKKLLNS